MFQQGKLKKSQIFISSIWHAIPPEYSNTQVLPVYRLI